jgi:DNA-binding NarL/FixJ family response regulator
MPAPIEITRRQMEAALLVREGLSTKEIAQRMRIATRTCEQFLTRIYRACGFYGGSSRVRLALAIERGEIAAHGRRTKNDRSRLPDL